MDKEPPLSSAQMNASLEQYDEFVEEPGLLGSAREIPAWAVSFGVHLLIGFFLYSITYVTGVTRDMVVTTSIDELTPEQFKFDTTVVDMVGSNSPANMLSPSMAAATHVGRDPQKETQERLDEELLTLETPVTDMIDSPNEAELVEAVDTTGSTEHPGGVEGSIDRLTFEIAASLKERKTLVIWLFDESLSLKERREKIADRFENVYRQLDLLKADPDKALKTAVASFGKETHIITPEPVDTVDDIVAAVRNVQPDESGVENVFSAVWTVANKWLPFRTKMHRNVMIIIVTDERGDDYGADGANLERTVQKLARYGMRVFCVGNAAIFGREKGFVTWKYDDGSTEDLPVDQGPETVAPERLQLAFWGTNSRDLEYMSAGYGPYALTRLCAETGGLYLVAGESRLQFDPEVMRAYTPDYRPIRTYLADMQKNPAKMALVNTAMATNVDRIPRPQLGFRAENDNVLRQGITEAQKPAAVLDYKLNEMLAMLQAGEKGRDKLDTPRWRASYDLAMGRVLAMRVRAYGYNAVLAEMKAQPKSFEKQGSNYWRLVPAKEINSGPAVRKLAKQATEYLTRVIDDHPGTPWAMLAERELSAPLGWDWKEASMNLSSDGRGNGNGKKGIQLADDSKKKKNMNKKGSGAQRVRPKL